MKTTVEDVTLEIFSSVAQFSSQKLVKKADLAEVGWPDSGSADSLIIGLFCKTFW